jgi:hypothetical protein
MKDNEQAFLERATNRPIRVEPDEELKVMLAEILETSDGKGPPMIGKPVTENTAEILYQEVRKLDYEYAHFSATANGNMIHVFAPNAHFAIDITKETYMTFNVDVRPMQILRLIVRHVGKMNDALRETWQDYCQAANLIDADSMKAIEQLEESEKQLLIALGEVFQQLLAGWDRDLEEIGKMVKALKATIKKGTAR